MVDLCSGMLCFGFFVCGVYCVVVVVGLVGVFVVIEFVGCCE